jgi:Spy/CpxP family protein refolding chaperone
MKNARFILTLLFVLALSSGVVAGMLVTRWPAVSGSPTTRPVAAARTPLAEELNLTDEQSVKMKAIWETARQEVDDCFTRAQALQRQRDETIYGLLTDEQKAKVTAAEKEYKDGIDALRTQREADFKAAVAKTEEILTAEQKKKYEQILGSRLHHGTGGPGPGGGPDWLGAPPSGGPGGEHGHGPHGHGPEPDSRQ